MASVFNTCIFSEQIKNSAKRYESEIMPLKLCLVFFIWMYTASGHNSSKKHELGQEAENGLVESHLLNINMHKGLLLHVLHLRDSFLSDLVAQA